MSGRWYNSAVIPHSWRENYDMASQTRRSQSKVSRRERRSIGASRSYVAPTPVGTAPVRRSYISEPASVDYTTEYRFIRKDLLRILLWAGLLTILMIALWFLPVL